MLLQGTICFLIDKLQINSVVENLTYLQWSICQLFRHEQLQFRALKPVFPLPQVRGKHFLLCGD